MSWRDTFQPCNESIRPSTESWITEYTMFKAPFAQPIVTLGYPDRLALASDSGHQSLSGQHVAGLPSGSRPELQHRNGGKARSEPGRFHGSFMTASRVYDPLQFERVHIRSDEALQAIAPRFDSADAIGIDIEMGQHVVRRPGGVQEWTHVLALIQIASESLSVLVDPLRCNDLSPLRPLLTGSTRKVFLGGGQDSALLDAAGIPARNIVDVGEIALAVFGRREDGMAALARRIFDLSLDKSVRRTDWMQRPLNPALLAYAYRDAELTLLIYRWFQEQYPEAVALHERTLLDARLSDEVAPWITAALTGQPVWPRSAGGCHGAWFRSGARSRGPDRGHAVRAGRNERSTTGQ